MMDAKVPVTERALLQRINRKLAPKYERVCKSRGREIEQLGSMHIVDTYSNTVTYLNVDLVDLARELKVMGEWEEMAS